MDTNIVVGGVLVLAGFADLVVAQFVLERRMPESPQKRIVINAVKASGAVLALIGSLVAAGWVKFLK